MNGSIIISSSFDSNKANHLLPSLPNNNFHCGSSRLTCQFEQSAVMVVAIAHSVPVLTEFYLQQEKQQQQQQHLSVNCCIVLD